MIKHLFGRRSRTITLTSILLMIGVQVGSSTSVYAFELPAQVRHWQGRDSGLGKRQNVPNPSPSADCSNRSTQPYHMPLHVGAVFILLIASAIGVYLPVILGRSSNPNPNRARASTHESTTPTDNMSTTRWDRTSPPTEPHPTKKKKKKTKKALVRKYISETLFVCKHFGTGVIISTAFVHLLAEAMDAWTNPCLLAGGQTLAYDATGPAVAMAAIWVMFCVDFFLFRTLRRKSSTMMKMMTRREEEEDGGRKRVEESERSVREGRGEDQGGVEGVLEKKEDKGQGVSRTRAACSGDENDDVEGDGEGEEVAVKERRLTELSPTRCSPASTTSTASSKSDTAAAATAAAPAAAAQDTERADSDFALQAQSAIRQKIAQWDVLTIEAGILFHSILVGVTLGVATGPSFTSLVIAITFHQLFEGLALGSRIVLLSWKSALYKVVIGALFAMSTPIGAAIGIAARTSFNDNDPATLLVIATVHSISAGILIYTALVELLAGDFIHSPEMQNSSFRRSAAAIAAVTAGIIAMSVIALWA